MRKPHPGIIRENGDKEETFNYDPSNLCFEEVTKAIRDILSYNDKGIYALAYIFLGNVDEINKASMDTVSVLVKAITQNWLLK